MKDKARFEGEDPVVVAGRMRGEVVLALMAGALLAMFVVAAIVGASDMDVFTCVLTAGMITFLVWALTGALWRLHDGGPVFQADSGGFRPHRSLSRDQIPWTDVRSVGIEPSAWRCPDVVRFRLRRRLWSFTHPLGTRELRLPLPYLGLSRRDATHLLRQLRRLRGATVITDRRPTSPDPDAAD